VTEDYDPVNDTLHGQCYKRAEGGKGKRYFWKWDVERAVPLEQTRLKLDDKVETYHHITDNILYVYKWEPMRNVAPVFLTAEIRDQIVTNANS
jgi:hypothetical protein